MTRSKFQLQKKCVLGVNTAVKGGVLLLDEEQVLYSSGNHVLIWNKYKRNQVFLHQCSNGEEIQLLSLCSSRKQIAIAVKSVQSGHHLILYDAINYKRKKVIKLQNAEDDSDVISLSFSQDGKQILVLRDAPFYFLTLWNVEKSAKAVASIRLATPSGKQMRTAQLRPSSDSREIVVCASGKGIIRFFKVVDGIFRPITVNLRREQQNYIVQRWLSSDVLILGTDLNELIVIQNFDMKNVVKIEGWKECITSMTAFSQGVIVGAADGSLRIYNCTNETQYVPTFAKSIVDGSNDLLEIVSIDKTPTEEFFICFDSAGKVSSYPLCDNEHAVGESMIPRFHTPSLNGDSCITCMDTCLFKPILATGGSDKTVRFWNFKTNNFELTRQFDTDIISLSLHPSSLQILICSQSHVELNYVYDKELKQTWRRDKQQLLHCKFSNGGQYFALICGPYVQVYDTYKFEPICTLRGHSARIETLAWRQDDQEVATIGLDGVVCKWNVSNGKRVIRYVNESADVSGFIGGCFNEMLDFALVNQDGNNHIGMINLLDASFQNNEKDSVDNTNIKAFHNGLVIATPKDDSFNGNLLIGHHTSNQEGFQMKKLHSEKVSIVLLTPSHLFTASEDGTLCICAILNQDKSGQELSAGFAGSLSHTTFQDILVPAEKLQAIEDRVKQLRVEIEKLKESQMIEIQRLSDAHIENSTRIKSQIEAITDKQKQANLDNKKYITNLKSQLEDDLSTKKDEFEQELQDLKSYKHKEQEAEVERFKKTTIAQEDKIVALKLEIQTLDSSYKQQMERSMNEMQLKIQYETDKYNDLLKEKNGIISIHEETIRKLEEDAELELADEMKSYESQSILEQKATLRLREENDISMKKYDALMKDFEEHKETITSLKEKQRDLSETITSLQNQKVDHENEIKQIERDILQLDVHINNSTEETSKMERTKISQSKLIGVLKDKLKPKEAEFRRLSDLSEDLDLKLKTATLQNDNYRVQVEGIERKLYMVTKDLRIKSREVNIKEDEVNRFEKELQDIVNVSDNFGEVHRRLIMLSKNQSGLHQDKQINSSKITMRMTDILRKEIKSKQEILDRHKRLHQTRMRKLKRDQIVLEEQLKETQQDSMIISQKQADILN